MSTSSSTFPLDGIAAIRHYIDRMLDSSSVEKTRHHSSSQYRHSSSSSSSQGKNISTLSPRLLMKAFLLDAVTTQIVSAVYSQTEILQKQVYLVARLDTGSKNSNEKQKPLYTQDQPQQDVGHLTALCFCRPTPNNIDALGRDLSNPNRPRFKEYHIYFTGIVTTGLLRLLAEQDIYERIVSVQEYYADFIPINPDLWSLQGLDKGQSSLVLTTAAGTSWAPKYASQYERQLMGLQSMLLALRRQPVCIRYAGHSACAEELAQDLHEAIMADDIFHFGTSGGRSKSSQSISSGGGGLVVLILDRRDDSVTPLLSQWTYQAMVHELLGLNNHRVVLKGAPGVDNKELDEVVLSPTQDDFFGQHLHSNFGELGEAIQRLLKDYQQKSAQHSQMTQNFSSVEEMQAFMEKFPEIRSQSHTVSKHVAIMGELARLVETCSLLDVSQFEQELASSTTLESQSSHWRQLQEKLNSPSIKVPDKLRLGLLYALRYETSGNLHMLQSAMSKGGVPQDLVQFVPMLLRYGGKKSRGPGLFGDHEHFTSKPNVLVSKMTKTFMSSVVLQGGVDNVYAQHVPLVMETIQAITKGKLSTKTHPIVPGSTATTTAAVASTMIPSEVLIFMVGGITYEEGNKVHEFNQQQHQQQSQSNQMNMHGNNSALKNSTDSSYYQQQQQPAQYVVLAGSTVHNSTSFLDELQKATSL